MSDECNHDWQPGTEMQRYVCTRCSAHGMRRDFGPDKGKVTPLVSRDAKQRADRLSRPVVHAHAVDGGRLGKRGPGGW